MDGQVSDDDIGTAAGERDRSRSPAAASEDPVAPDPITERVTTPAPLDLETDPLPVAGRPERRWTLPLRIAISLALLALLIVQAPDFDARTVLPSRELSNVLWLAVALLLTAAGVFLSTVRWQTVLHALGDRSVRLRRLLSHYLAGQFVSNILPTTIGGDVVRVARLSKDNGDSARTFASVVLERLTGWLVLPLITIIGFALDPTVRGLGRVSLLALAIAGGTLVGLGLILFAADHQRLLGRFASHEGWLRFAGAVHLGVNRLRHRPAAAAAVVAAGLLYQFVLVLSAAAAANALGITEIGLTALLAFLPAVLIAQVLPIGINGLGVREAALVVFLTPLDVAAAQAIALGLLLYLLTLVVSLAGAPAFAFGGRRAPAR